VAIPTGLKLVDQVDEVDIEVLRIHFALLRRITSVSDGKVSEAAAGVLKGWRKTSEEFPKAL